jgi:hypothetical protein
MKKINNMKYKLIKCKYETGDHYNEYWYEDMKGNGFVYIIPH